MPKTSSDDLFKLLNSLTPAEKRYFRLYNGMNQGDEDNLYSQLFDVLSELKVYDEKIVLAAIPQIKKSQLSNLKSYLFDHVLESLITFKKKNSIDIRLRHGINEIEILYNKKLYHSCHKKIHSLKKLASKHEKFLYELIITRWEKSLFLTELDIKKIKSKIEQEEDDEIKMLRVYENFLRYDKLISKVIYIEYKYGYERNREIASELKKLLNDDLIKNESSALSRKSLRIIYQIKSTYYYVIRKFDLSVKYLLKVIDEIEAELKFNEGAFPGYITQLKNVLITYMFIGDRAGFERTSEKLRTLEKNYRIARNEEIKIKIYETLLSLQLNFYIQFNDHKKSELVANETIRFLDKYENKIIRIVLLDFYGLLSTHFFLVKNFSESQRWNNKVLNFPGNEIKRNELTYARIMDLMLNYELGNEFLIESRLRSTERFMKKLNKLGDVEMLIIKLFKELLHAGIGSDHSDIFGIYLRKLKRMKKDKTDSELVTDLRLTEWLSEKI